MRGETMKQQSVIILCMLLMFPCVFALDRYVTLTVNNVQTMDGVEVEFGYATGFGTAQDNWAYCVDGTTDCIPMTQNLSAGWAMTKGPYSSWAGGETHQAVIAIKGDGVTGSNGQDMRMKYPGPSGLCRAWRMTHIADADCNMDDGSCTSDLAASQNAGFFACGRAAELDENCNGGTSAGYADVDDCINSPAGMLAWTFSFTVP
jgi:hypothetical protein